MWLEFELAYYNPAVQYFNHCTTSGPGNNGNQRALYIPQVSKTEDSPSDGLVSYSEHSGVGGNISLTYPIFLSNVVGVWKPVDKIQTYNI